MEKNFKLVESGAKEMLQNNESKRPKAVVLRTAGTNCDWETQKAFELAGADVERVHINRIIKDQVRFSDFDILAIPGGFSYGDDIASGKILANEIKYKLGDHIKEFAESGRPVIGICNGFQVLVKMGLLPYEGTLRQKVTLTFNDSDKFECRWIKLKGQGSRVKGQGTSKSKTQTRCLWTKDLPEIIDLPVAHAEGKFVANDKKILNDIERSNQVVFRYCDAKGKSSDYPDNPNGSVNDIAGICNKKGNVLGLMPHPERNIFKWQNPDRQGISDKTDYSWGLKLFENAVEFVKSNK